MGSVSTGIPNAEKTYTTITFIDRIRGRVSSRHISHTTLTEILLLIDLKNFAVFATSDFLDDFVIVLTTATRHGILWTTYSHVILQYTETSSHLT